MHPRPIYALVATAIFVALLTITGRPGTAQAAVAVACTTPSLLL